MELVEAVTELFRNYWEGIVHRYGGGMSIVKMSMKLVHIREKDLSPMQVYYYFS